MKVSVTDFKNAVLMFESKIISQATNETNQSALAIAFTKFAPQIDEAIAQSAKDGIVDVDEVRALVDAGIKGGGGKIVLKPQFPSWVALIGVSIKDITITKEEADEFFNQTIPSVSPSAIE